MGMVSYRRLKNKAHIVPTSSFESQTPGPGNEVVAPQNSDKCGASSVSHVGFRQEPATHLSPIERERERSSLEQIV